MQVDKRFREFRPIPPKIQALPRGGKAEKVQCFQGIFQIYKEKPPGKAPGPGPFSPGERESARGGPPLYYNSIGQAGRAGEGHGAVLPMAWWTGRRGEGEKPRETLGGCPPEKDKRAAAFAAAPLPENLFAEKT